MQKLIETIAKECTEPLGIPELDCLQEKYPSVGEDRPIYYRFLYKLAPFMPKFIELGCRSGHASYHVLKGNLNAEVHGVDKRTVVDPMVLNEPRFKFHNKLTLDEDLLNSFPNGYFDAVMIDSSHKYIHTRNEYRKWIKKVNKNYGFILMDDILHNGYGCTEFWKEIKEDKQAFEYLHPNGWGFGIVTLEEKL